jgi:hypothetical protein
MLIFFTILFIQGACCSNSIDLSKPLWGVFAEESPGNIPASSLTPVSSQTSAIPPTITPSLSPTQTVVPSETVAPICLLPLTPVNDSAFDSYGKISFSWVSNVEAASYLVMVTAPNGTEMQFATEKNPYSRYVESFPWGGDFTWHVIALDANGEELCQSKTSSFSKKETLPTATAVPRGSGKKRSTPGGYQPTMYVP